jgi:ribosomal protein S18 acetylase RimI-like enzyme
MEAPQPGHFWKTPFFWSPGTARPSSSSCLHFCPADTRWLSEAVSEVMTSSMDESDQAAVTELGAAKAASELLEVPAEYFEVRQDWWLQAKANNGQPVGFVLLALLKPEKYWKDGRTQGTIYYMGVLPGQRGRGHAVGLLNEAMRLFSEAACWRVFCDTSSRNEPMVKAFRTAGFEERAPWQRPVR